MSSAANVGHATQTGWFSYATMLDLNMDYYIDWINDKS